MSDYRFDGRVAVVTGAGRGIGRAHAHLLGALGAAVVVNDLGGSKEGTGADAGPAHQVAEEIVAAGGTASADTNDVSSVDGASAIVAAALDAYGRIDVVVNNAGIVRWADMPEADIEYMRKTLDVHVLGSFNVTKAAWPHMVDQKYGRVVMTTSHGMLGLPGNLAYATAKAGLVGMTRNMVLSGREHNIRINLIAPAAFTRMGADPNAEQDPADAPPYMTPDLVAPMVAFLAHEDCPVTGEIYAAGAGRFARLFIAGTQGYVQLDPAPTVADVAQHWDEINDETGYYVPVDLAEWAGHHMEHMAQAAGSSD